MPCFVKWILIDFGGVLAEEGFVRGLRSLARKQGLDPDLVQEVGIELVFQTGYVIGRAAEETFWQAVRHETGLWGADQDLRRTILDHFLLRPWMVETIKRIRQGGTALALLSDQVNWLDELNERDQFFPLFDRVFNSYHLGQSKRDPELFSRVTSLLGITPEQALFVDDSRENVARAKSRGLSAIHFTDKRRFLQELQTFCPGL